MANPQIRINALSPLGVRIVESSPSGGLDLRTVISATMQVSKPDGSLATWSAIVSGQVLNGDGSTTAVFTHYFLPGDVNFIGTFKVIALMNVPPVAPALTGTVGSSETEFDVFDPLAR